MRLIASAVCVLALGAVAAGNKPGGPPEDKARASARGKELVAHQPVQWLKVYTLPVYRERWRLEGEVADLGQALPQVREAFARTGASLGGPGDGAPGAKLRRLTYRCPKESAQRALQEIGRLGTFSAPAVQAIMEPVSLAEVQGKIAALQADKARHAKALARMPAVSALVDELLGHLRGVESALRKPEVEVLVELTLSEKS